MNKKCKECKEEKPISEFYRNGNNAYRAVCKLCWNDRNGHRTKEYRHNIKRKLVELLGGECSMCGYKKCMKALEFHHTHPENKEYTIAYLISQGQTYETCKVEAEKCILLCSNCHKEIEYNNQPM